MPFNLSISLGISGPFDRPEFLDTVAIIEVAASAKGAALGGGPVRTQAETIAFLEKGYRIVGAFDIFQLKGAAAQMASWVKDA